MERGHPLAPPIGMAGINPYRHQPFSENKFEVLESAREAVYK
jgi:hypothetical protein